MGVTATRSRIDVARAVAHELLRDLTDRWAHTVGVASRAVELAGTVDPAERELLVVAAWLHDIGYSPAVRDTGFHPLDGAAYLHRHGWPDRICGLVAHHSGALIIARGRGLEGTLTQYRHEQSPVSDALTHADQTIGPQGQPMTVDQRMVEKLARHDPNSVQARLHHAREPHLRAVAARVEQRLSTSGGKPAGQL
jgi:putative nucleotidyltransferase with HDIG domain